MQRKVSKTRALTKRRNDFNDFELRTTNVLLILILESNVQ